MNNDFVLELPTDIRTIEHAVEYVIQQCEDCYEVEHKLRLNFRVGLSEALSNAMLYGNGHDPSKRVRVEVRITDGKIEARVVDQGDGFNPCVVPDPTEPENLLKCGGRGLFLMRQLLDEVSFNERGNEVRLVLNLESDAPLEGGAPA
ncbi:MAG: ATP-binding protein [Gemmatimonadota bacterium]